MDKKVNIILLIIAVLIIVGASIKIILKDNSVNQEVQNIQETQEKYQSESQFKDENEEKFKDENEINNKEELIWKLKIPTISLEANIREGTSIKILDEYIGHFENTNIKNGNIGLAAHNRGYRVNYFRDIKFLKNGDEIIYQYGDDETIYEVFLNIIIKDIDWSYLEETDNNIITLITCVEDQPSQRRCIQAIERIE